jgi:hypothetical protein
VRRAEASGVRLVALAAVVALLGSACGTFGFGLGGHGTPGGPLLGLIDTDGAHYGAEVAAGVQVVTISLSWTQAEPAPGRFSAAYATRVRGQIEAARSHHLAVIADPGLQFPPAWVFGLPGGTRFVDQYGDVFRGAPGSGDDVANGVTDPAVRDAMGRYLDWLGGQIPRGRLWGVRQGGGPLGELRYPAGTYGGHRNCWWAYDASTQVRSPVAGWRPGTGTVDQARQFLIAYDGALVVFGQWLNDRFRTDFATRSLVMLPGWGERPGTSQSVVASRLTSSPEEFNEGLDWRSLLATLPDARHAVAYTTYLDAPSARSTPQLEDPATYVAALARADHLMVGGENTGTPSAAALDISLWRARRLGYAVVNWMDERRVLHGAAGQPTLSSLESSAESILG